MFSKLGFRWTALAVVALLCTPAAAEMETERNKAVIRAMVEAVNQRDLAALDALVAEDVKRHSDATAGVVVENRQQFKAFLEADFATVPNSVQVMRGSSPKATWWPFKPPIRATRWVPSGRFHRRASLSISHSWRFSGSRMGGSPRCGWSGTT